MYVCTCVCVCVCMYGDAHINNCISLIMHSYTLLILLINMLVTKIPAQPYVSISGISPYPCGEDAYLNARISFDCTFVHFINIVN